MEHRSMTSIPCPLVVTDELPASTFRNPTDEPQSMGKSLYVFMRCDSMFVRASRVRVCTSACVCQGLATEIDLAILIMAPVEMLDCALLQCSTVPLHHQMHPRLSSLSHIRCPFLAGGCQSSWRSPKIKVRERVSMRFRERGQPELCGCCCC